MTTELYFLATAVILGLVHLIVDSHLISFQLGYRWTASSREQPVPPLHGVANRLEPGLHKFHGDLSALRRAAPGGPFCWSTRAANDLGSTTLLLGRVGYVLAAAAGFGLVRSALCFNTALAGMVLLLIALLK